MIGSLFGKVELFDTSSLLLDVSGVGYKVLVPSSILSKIQSEQKVKLYIYTHVREDTFDLFGFLEKEDLFLFERLLSVSGIGPKTAMGIFSFGSRSAIISAILKADVSFFTSVPRLGTKNAQKIIIELKGKLGEGMELDLSSLGADQQEIISALRQFGFTNKEAQDALRQLKGKGEKTEDKIRLALKYLGK